MWESNPEHIRDAAKLLDVQHYIDFWALSRVILGSEDGIANYSSVKLEMEAIGRSGYALGGSVYVKFGDDDIRATGASVTLRMDRIKTLPGCQSLNVGVYISWSSSRLSVSNAVVALDVYRKAVLFAARVEAFIRGRMLVIAKPPEEKT